MPRTTTYLASSTLSYGSCYALKEESGDKEENIVLAVSGVDGVNCCLLVDN